MSKFLEGKNESGVNSMLVSKMCGCSKMLLVTKLWVSTFLGGKKEKSGLTNFRVKYLWGFNQIAGKFSFGSHFFVKVL